MNKDLKERREHEGKSIPGRRSMEEARVDGGERRGADT